VIVTMPPRTIGGQEPPAAVAAAMAAADVVICQASYALIHTEAVRGALAAKRRVLEFWGVEEEMLVAGGLTADYAEVDAVGEGVARLLAGAQTARLRTAAGTDLSVRVEGRAIVHLGGTPIAAGGGLVCSLPGGEIAISPVEGSAEGVLVDPFLLEKRDIGRRTEPVRIEVRGGFVTTVEGGREAEILRRMLDDADHSARNIAEFALGTNRWCRIWSGIREAKKAYGTAHVAIGDSRSIGGTVESAVHMDMIFTDPVVTFDDRVVMSEGRIHLQ
jgi:leucyl aminopeptidase (aminopeptidase T)